MMLRLLPILLLTGCGLVDTIAKPGMFRPSDRIDVHPGMFHPDPPVPCEFPVLPPPGDWNGDGGVDGFDLEAFYGDWNDGAADVNWDGVCDECDVLIFFNAWEQG